MILNTEYQCNMKLIALTSHPIWDKNYNLEKGMAKLKYVDTYNIIYKWFDNGVLLIEVRNI